MYFPGPDVLFPVAGICDLFLALGGGVLYKTFCLKVEFLELKKCSDVVGPRAGDLVELFQDQSDLFSSGFSFRFLRLGDSKYALFKGGARNLQEGIFPSQKRFLLMMREVLTGQTSLQREQGKNIVVHFIIFSLPSPIKFT